MKLIGASCTMCMFPKLWTLSFCKLLSRQFWFSPSPKAPGIAVLLYPPHQPLQVSKSLPISQFLFSFLLSNLHLIFTSFFFQLLKNSLPIRSLFLPPWVSFLQLPNWSQREPLKALCGKNSPLVFSKGVQTQYSLQQPMDAVTGKFLFRSWLGWSIPRTDRQRENLSANSSISSAKPEVSSSQTSRDFPWR